MEGHADLLVGEVPLGFQSSSRSGVVGPAVVFEALARDVLCWAIQREAGIRMIYAESNVREGASLVARIRGVPGTIRCEVVAVIDEPDRKGFVVETVPGHTLQGREAFVVERRGTETHFTVIEYSRPKSWIARLPGARAVQRRVLDRYVPAAMRVASRHLPG
jgi:uncharacterized protein (UPF0548 family)